MSAVPVEGSKVPSCWELRRFSAFPPLCIAFRFGAGHAPRGLVALLSLLLLSVSTVAGAHAYAQSSLSLKTEGADVRAGFHLDAQSVADMVTKRLKTAEPVEKERLAEHAEASLAYLDEHFEITRGGQKCVRGPAERLNYVAHLGRLMFDARYRCPNADNLVEVRSELFLEEGIPHQVLATLVHERAMERYFFTGGERKATIHLDRLAQRDAVAPPPGGVRIAQPPPGAFAASAPSAEETQPSASDAESAPTEALGTGFWTFLREGVLHIFSGIDHILFVLSLLLVTRTWRDMAVVVTGFTVAHSVTLALGALDLISVSPRLVEPLIAASIAYVAVDNIVRKDPRGRLAVTLGFGLIHGLGFSQGLRELGLPAGLELVPPLLGFNLGVELGQLLIVLPLFPLLLLLQRREALARRVVVATSAVVAVIAAWWFVERLVA